MNNKLISWVNIGLLSIHLSSCSSYICMPPACEIQSYWQHGVSRFKFLAKDGEAGHVIESKIPRTPNIDPTSLTFRKYLALSSVALGGLLYLLGIFQPSSPLGLLQTMEKESPVFNEVVCNGKPSVVDFYADWCETCKALAPRLRLLQLQYRDQINFITVDGAKLGSERMVQLFNVDGIPHVAFLSVKGDLVLTLVGDIPKSVLGEQINKMIADQAFSVGRAVNAGNPSFCSADGGGRVADLL